MTVPPAYRLSKHNDMLSLTIVEIFCTIMPLYPIVSILLFNQLRRHVFNQLILNISICSFFFNLSYFFFVGKTGCIVSGLFHTYFDLSQVFWTSTLMYFTYKIFEGEKATISPKRLNLINWGYPALAVSLQYIFGRNDLDQHCLFTPRNSSKVYEDGLLSTKFIFITLVYICLNASSLFLTFKILYRYYILKLMSNRVIWKFITDLLLYQVIESTFLIGYYILIFNEEDLVQYDGDGDLKLTPQLETVYIMNMLLGPVYSLFFFFNNKKSRLLWSQLLGVEFLCRKCNRDNNGLLGSSSNTNRMQEESAFHSQYSETGLSKKIFSEFAPYEADSHSQSNQFEISLTSSKHSLNDLENFDDAAGVNSSILPEGIAETFI